MGASFSGGEKARLALALIVWQRPNLRLLDEPTNHLDIEMRESLAQALVDFEGGLVVVAHDRALLSAATDQWMLVADGKVEPFDGDLDDYKQWARQYQAAGGKAVSGKTDARSRRDERRAQAQERQRQADLRKPFEKRIAAIEKEMEPLSKEAADTEQWLAGSEAYTEEHRERLQETLKRRAEIAQRIEALENDWLWTQAEMEKAMK